MKRRLIAVVIGMLYIAVLVSLLILQTLTMQGSVTSYVANVITLLLVIPIIFLFKAYMRFENSGKSGASIELSGDEEALQEQGEKSQEQISSAYYAFVEEQGLSSREQEVGWLIYRGYSNLQIAEELYISEATVKKHASHIYEKLQISGRKEFKEQIKGKIE